MKYTTLPYTDIEVSKLCLGTMTWGQQNTEEEAHQQMDFAYEQGINFFDTAELYPVPALPKTQGLTETYIGNWLEKRGLRNKIVLATKVVGPGAFVKHIRESQTFNHNDIKTALEMSLKRLKTEVIDLYQLHWPERSANLFGERIYPHKNQEKWEDNFQEILSTLDSLIKEGKIKHIGVSNETPWGIMKYIELAKQGFPRMITVQNVYSLLNRLFENSTAEVSLRENVGLLAYSPLAFGVLTGKYLNGKGPDNARLNLFPNFERYRNEASMKAIHSFKKVAEENNLSLTQLALAYVTQKPFVTSNIIGATTLEQLKENIDSINVELTPTILKSVEKAYRLNPDPTP